MMLQIKIINNIIYTDYGVYQKNGIFTLDLTDFLNINILFNLSLLLIICRLLIKKLFYKHYPTYNLTTDILQILLFISCYILYSVTYIYLSPHNSKIYLFNKTFLIDHFSIAFKILILLFFLFFSFLFESHFKNNFNVKNDIELYSYFILLLFFLMFLLESYDFISFLITLEASTFIIIALLFSQNYSDSSKEAGFKYFFFHGVSSSCLVLTIILFIYIFKTTNYITLLYYFLFSNIFLKIYFHYMFLSFFIEISVLSLFFFILFKYSIFPCHFWVTSFYEGSFLLLLIFFTTIFKLFVLNFFLKIYFFMILTVKPLIYILVLLSIMYSSKIAFFQKKIRRYWAFSTINNFSFFFFTILFCNYFWGLQLGLFFIVIYLFMTFIFFTIIFFTRNILKGYLLYYITDFSFIQTKIILVAFIILFFSLSGLPPFLGFFGKCFIFLGIINVNYISILFFFVFYSLYSSIYYLRLVKQIYFLQLNQTKQTVFVFHTNLFLKTFINLLLITLIFSFNSASNIFKLCFLYINYLTNV